MLLKKPRRSGLRMPPRTYVCPACGWKRYVSDTSDALHIGTHFDTCPKCGSENIEVRDPAWTEEFGEKLGQVGEMLGIMGRKPRE